MAWRYSSNLSTTEYSSVVCSPIRYQVRNGYRRWVLWYAMTTLTALDSLSLPLELGASLGTRAPHCTLRSLGSLLHQHS